MRQVQIKLLIVDDEASIRNSLSSIFGQRGLQVCSSADALLALEEIGREAPDILLSDLNMPGMSGFELLSKVRRHFPGIYVIAMSAAYLGNEVPPGVPADAFYAKARSSPSLLLHMVEDVITLQRRIGPARSSLAQTKSPVAAERA